MAETSEAVRIIRVRGVPEGLENLASKLQKVSEAHRALATSSDASAVATETSAKKQISAQRAFDALEARTDAATRAYQQFSRELNTVSRAFDTGVFGKGAEGAARLSAEIDGAKQRLQSLGSALAKGSAGLDGILGIGRAAMPARDSAAVFEAEAARLESLAQQRAGQIGAEFGRELAERLSPGVAKSARDAANVFSAELDRMDNIAKLKAEQAGQEFSRTLNASMIKGSGKSAADSARVFQDQEKALQGLRVEHDQLAIAEERRTAAESTLNDFARKGLVTEAQRVTMLDSINKRFDDTSRALAGAGVPLGKYVSGVGLARHELVNLSRQAQDVFVSLASGQSPMTVLIQQGTQIADVFSTSKGSVGAFFGQVVAGAGRFITSAAGVATGLVAAGAAAAFAGHQFAEGQREIERSLTGIGRASGTSVAEINRIAEASAAAANISVTSAREIATGFASTGKIGPGLYGDLTGLTKNFAAQSGQGRPEAAAELAKAFSDPLKGADALNEKLGFLDDRTRTYIRTLTEQGNRTEAQKVLFDALSQSVSGAADRTSLLGKAWNAVANGASNAWDAIGKAMSGQLSLEEKLAAAIEKRNNMAGGLKARTATGQRLLASQDNTVEDLNEQIRRSGAARSLDARNAQQRASSLETGAIVDALNPADAELRKLQGMAASITKFAQNPDWNATPDRMRQVADSAAAVQKAIESWISPTERLARVNDINVRSAQARTLAERAAVEVARLTVDAAGDVVKQKELELRIQGQITQMQAQANREAQDAVRTAKDQLELSTLRPYQRRVREIEMTARDNRERFGGTAGASPSPSLPATTAAVSGMDTTFAESLRKMMADIPGISVTSGFRSTKRQAELWSGALDKYGSAEAARKWVAPPGNSQHEQGLAADLRFGPGAREAAHANASKYGLTFPLGNEPWHVEPIGGRSRAGVPAIGDAAATTVEGAQKAAAANEEWNSTIRAGNDNLKAQGKELELQARSYGMSSEAIATAQKAQELYNQFAQSGMTVTPALAKAIDDLAMSYGRQANAMSSVKLMNDLRFERDQIGRSPDDQQVASKLRGAGLTVDLGSAEADSIRLNSRLTETKDLLSGAAKGFVADLRAGKTAAEALSGVLDQVATKMANKAIDTLISSLFGSSGGFNLFGGSAGVTASAKGNIFEAGDFHAFANGGAFTNSIVNKPTLFPFAKGTGLMGEAGPEAIMPLSRGPDGRLGVSAPHYLHPPANTNSAPVAPNITLSTTIDARGSQMTEGQFNSILNQRDAKLLARVPAVMRQYQGRAG